MAKHEIIKTRHIKQWLMPLLLLVCACILYLYDNKVVNILQFDRQQIEQQQYWRLLSGNLLHTNLWHLLFNLAGLLMLTHLFGRLIGIIHFISFSIVNFVCVGALLYLFSPEIIRYVGLSGYLHGLFVLGCLVEIHQGRLSSLLLLAGIAAKVGWEIYHGASEQMAVLIDASVATDAHLYGALAALPWFGAYWLICQFKRKYSLLSQ